MFYNFKLLRKFFSLLNIPNWKLLIFLIFFIFVSLIDIINLSLIAPFIVTLIDPAKLDNFIIVSYLEQFNIENKLLFFGYSIIIIFFIKTILTILVRWLIKRFALSIEKKLQLDLITSYLNIDYESFIKKKSSEIYRNIKDLSLNSAAAIDMTLRVLSETIILLAILIFLSTVSFKSLLFLMLITLLVFLIYQVFLKPLNIELGSQRVEAIKNQYKYIEAGIKGYKEIKTINKENFIIRNLDKFNNFLFKINLKSSLITDTPRYVLELFILSAAIIILLNAKIGLNNFSDIIPSIGIFLFAGARILPGSSAIIVGMNVIHNNIRAIDTVYNELKNLKYNNKEIKLTNNLKDPFIKISLDKCSFAFKNNKKKILDKIDFFINSKDCVGITGESGSGKTTLAELVLGLLKPLEGEIKYNNISTKDLSKNLLGKAAYITQEPVILDDSIMTNVALSKNDKDINKEKLMQSLKNANLLKFINTLPKGIYTEIGGETGIRLSGGQNRRMALARAFYHGDEIIILDEATSSLDVENENKILEQIKSLRGKMTFIIISHQKNTLKYCNKVYEVINNKVILKNVQ